MAQQHTVQAGDTVGAVAKRYNVPNSAVSGFRSKDPNVIFPDEVLQIDDSQVIGGAPAPVAQPGVQQQGQVVDGNALQPTGGLPQGPAPAPVVQQGTVVEGTSLQPTQGVPAPTTAPVAQPVAQPAPVQAPVQAPAPTGDPALDSITQGVQQAQLQAADIQRQMDELLNAPDVVGDQVNGQTDGGVDNTPEAKSSEFFSQFGVSSDALGQGLNNNPFGTISDLVSQVMKATGLPDVRDDITNIANELEGIENQRDDEIAAVEDDPFVSAGSKQNKIARINKNYENRINNRVNKLTLLQKTQQDARQQAQFAATTAINLFGKQQEFEQGKLEDILDRQEKAAEAERQTSLDDFNRQMDIANFDQSERKLAFEQRKAQADFNKQVKRETQVVDIGGTKKLIDTQTGEVVMDFVGANTDAGSEDSLNNLSLANEILSNSDAISGFLGGTGTLPFTEARSTALKFDQLKGILSLENRKLLKGSGQISDFEARTLEKAATSLDRSLSEADFAAELKRVKGAFATSAGLEADVKITNPDTGEEKIGKLGREGINSAISQGFTIEYN